MTKRILITGKNSYIGKSLKKWLLSDQTKYQVDTISLRENSWRNLDFSSYDVLLHTVGIAHIKETKQNEELYYAVNRDLTYEVANKSKKEGISQFIFLSSMSVYGLETGVIDKTTPLKPKNAYGRSKLEAEKLIQELASESFKVSIVRPPMVYGRNCKGNYPRLAKLALKTPIFPAFNNKRSMLYIDNLSEFVKQLIDNCSNGVFLPQNAEYVNTTEMVKLIAQAHENKMMVTKLFNPFFKTINLSAFKKVFGDLIYEKEVSEYKFNYRVVDLERSIKLTEE